MCGLSDIGGNILQKATHVSPHNAEYPYPMCLSVQLGLWSPNIAVIATVSVLVDIKFKQTAMYLYIMQPICTLQFFLFSPACVAPNKASTVKTVHIRE